MKANGLKIGDKVRARGGEYEGYPAGSPYNLPRDFGTIVTGGDGFIVIDYGSFESPPVAPASFTKGGVGPVRTVTRKEIVPGKYGRINLTSGGAAGMVTIYTDGHVFSPTELRAAAATFIELADALEEGV